MLSETFYKLWNAGILQRGIWETIYMTVISTVISYVIGLPLGAGRVLRMFPNSDTLPCLPAPGAQGCSPMQQ